MTCESEAEGDQARLSFHLFQEVYENKKDCII